MSSQERITHLIDPDTWRAMDETLSPVDPLEFTDMKVRRCSCVMQGQTEAQDG